MSCLERFTVRDQADIESVRRRAGDCARSAGQTAEQVAEWVLVASELASNLVRHATGGGTVSVCESHSPSHALVLETHDSGPGIACVADALRDGFTTANGLGGGLPTVRRFSDSLDIQTSPAGTSVVARRRLP